MTKRRKPNLSLGSGPEATLGGGDDQVERALGRVFALGLPMASIAGALITGALVSVGSALLVLAGGALLGAIALFWASVRTLSGDSPLATNFAAIAVAYSRGSLVEEKRRVLRALKDLENEHDIGKIDDADYRTLTVAYRDQAKAVMRQMDIEIAPFREQAERLADEHLKKHAIREQLEESASAAATTARIECRACRASNEADAAFCKQCGSPVPVGSSSAQA
jgi:hypothetical protein